MTTNSGKTTALSLGPNVVELLLPQRWPLLMIDRIETFSDGPSPTLEASRMISASDVVFQGHFPGLRIWPGCLTIEGMGQTGAALMALLTIRERMAAETGDRDAGFTALRNLELGFRMQPGFRPDNAAMLHRVMKGGQDRIGVGTAVSVKLKNPVFAGQRLDYRVTIAPAAVADMMRFQVEALVGATLVAEGTLTGAFVPRIEIGAALSR
jgi:3-hydroxyacyl-[acyl-carrier-protein] dehydratase